LTNFFQNGLIEMLAGPQMPRGQEKKIRDIRSCS